MCTAIYPGSFDPPTYGHLDIIKRSAAMFDEVVICVMYNGAKNKSLFSAQERVELLRAVCAELPKVRVESYEGLLAEYAKRFCKPVIVRGLRSGTDFDYEMQMAAINKKINGDIETVFLPASECCSAMCSSAAREMGKYHKQMHWLVPPLVESAVRKKFADK